MEKLKERCNKYEISLRYKSNGYYEARTTFNLGGGNSNRIQKGGKTDEAAIFNLLTALYDFIKSSYESGLITCKIDDIAKSRIINSINNLSLNETKITQKVLEIINLIDGINAHILNKIFLPNNVVAINNSEPVNSLKPSLHIIPKIDNNDTIKPEENLSKLNLAKPIFIEWIEYKFSLCEKNPDNPKPLCRKTIDGYYRKIKDYILPYMIKHQKAYLQELTDEFITGLLKSVNGQTGKRHIYIVLNQVFKYAIKKKIVKDNPMQYIDKPKQIKKSESQKAEDYIKPEEQNIWLDAFEKENTDMSILFETMLLAGLRSEEACRTKMESIPMGRRFFNNK